MHISSRYNLLSAKICTPVVQLSPIQPLKQVQLPPGGRHLPFIHGGQVSLSRSSPIFSLMMSRNSSTADNNKHSFIKTFRHTCNGSD